jgi:hypothetical protein
MKPLLHVLGKALPLSFFAALLAATQVEGEGPVQALAVAVGVCAAGYFGAWAAHFLSYPRRYGRKAVLAAARSLSWLALAFPLTVATVFAFAPLTGDPGNLAQWLVFVVGLIASELSILAYSERLHSVMAEHQRRSEGARHA